MLNAKAETAAPGRPPRLRIRSIEGCREPKNLSARNGNIFSTATMTSLRSSSQAIWSLKPSA
jgi:hypothetical protein